MQYKGSGLGRCSMQLAGGCLIHKLYPLTLSVATRSLSRGVGAGGARGASAPPLFEYRGPSPSTFFCIVQGIYRSWEL